MVNQGAKKRTLDTSPISGASSLPATYFHDVIYITSFVQLMSIISDKFWYTYLVIPAFGEYKSFRFIRGFLSSVSEGEVEDEKTRKKREKMEKKASRPKFVKARNRYWAIRLGHSTLPWTSSDCFNTSGGSVAAVEESPINFFKRLTWNTGWSFEEFEQSRFAYKATASGTGPSGWATPLCLGPPQSASTHQVTSSPFLFVLQFPLLIQFPNYSPKSLTLIPLFPIPLRFFVPPLLLRFLPLLLRL